MYLGDFNVKPLITLVQKAVAEAAAEKKRLAAIKAAEVKAAAIEKKRLADLLAAENKRILDEKVLNAKALAIAILDAKKADAARVANSTAEAKAAAALERAKQKANANVKYFGTDPVFKNEDKSAEAAALAVQQQQSDALKLPAGITPQSTEVIKDASPIVPAEAPKNNTLLYLIGGSGLLYFIMKNRKV